MATVDATKIKKLTNMIRKIKRALLVKMKAMLHLGSDPDFLIIGVQKSGTTSLYNYITRYAANFIDPLQKELYFFSENYQKGFNYYKSLFPAFKGYKITGEATPDYIFYHRCAERIYKKYPQIKIIVVLRNPIARAYSQYCFQKYTESAKIYDPMSFDEAVRREDERYTITKNTIFFREYKYYSYKKEIMIIEANELKNKTRKVIDEVFTFLGLVYKNNIPEYHQLYNTNKYAPMELETHLYLHHEFESHNRKLYELLGKKFDW